MRNMKYEEPKPNKPRKVRKPPDGDPPPSSSSSSSGSDKGDEPLWNNVDDEGYYEQTGGTGITVKKKVAKKKSP